MAFFGLRIISRVLVLFHLQKQCDRDIVCVFLEETTFFHFQF